MMTDEELAGYILEKFENPDVVVKRGKDGAIMSEALPPPTLQGICFELRITAAEFAARCEGSVELKRAVELCYQREYDLVFRGGLSGELNANFAGLVMKNRQGWAEKSDSRVTNVEVKLPAAALDALGRMGLLGIASAEVVGGAAEVK